MARFINAITGLAILFTCWTTVFTAARAAGDPLAPAPAAVTAPAVKDWTLNLQDVDVRVFLQQVSAITGQNFIIDPLVKGKVTVVSSSPMDAREVGQLVQNVLRVNGLSEVTSGSVVRIVPQADPKAGAPAAVTGSAGMVTRVIPVRYVTVEDAVKILKPLASAAGYVEGAVSSGAVVVSDYDDNVRQMVKTLQGVDLPDSGGQEIVPLQEARAEAIAPMIQALLPAPGSGGDKGRGRALVIADPRSNSLIVQGQPPERARIRGLIAGLDKKTTGGSDIQLIRLQYADAKDIAPLLRGMIFPSAQGNAPAEPHPVAASTPTTAGLATANPGLVTSQPGIATGHANAPDSVNGDALSVDTLEAAQDAQGAGGGFIQADIALNALIVRAPPVIMAEVQSLVKQLDVQRPQVLIEAAIVEVTTDQANALGVQFGAGDAARSIHAGTSQFSANEVGIGSLLSQLGAGTAASAVGDGLSVAIGNNGGFTALVQALANTSGVNLLSAPSITTLDNEEAQIVVGQNVPFRTGSFSTQNSGVADPFTTIERQDIGITLKVVPQIYEGNIVRLTIAQEVSSIANNGIASGAADLITNKRTINTKVVAKDGQVIVLGGLMEDDAANSVDKVPVLGDIPVLGYLFKNSQKSATKRDLVVFLRPTVIRAAEKMSGITQGRFTRMSSLQDVNTRRAQDILPGIPPVATSSPGNTYDSRLFNPPVAGGVSHAE